ncbi:MAG: hypothetical protein HYY18_16850 [Planctomycetes bacterium]|nr:hypothetical protein [Planctomycetota bacterium]
MSTTMKQALRVRFRRLGGLPGIRALNLFPEVHLHVLAGRLTPVDAWLDLELTGDREAIERTVEGFRLRGMQVELPRSRPGLVVTA